MTEDKRKALEDIVDYSGVKIDESQLEQQLETALTEKLSDLDSLRDDLQHIGSVDQLGDTILNAIWDQFATQVAISAGEDFLRENRGLTLDLSDEAHIQSTENFAEGLFATHYTGDIDFRQRYDDWQKNFQRDDVGNIIYHTTRGGKLEPTLVKDARKPYDASRPKGSKEAHIDIDHTVPAARYIRDAGANAHLTEAERVAHANSAANLREMDSSLNKSKSDMTMEQWLDNPNARGQKPDEIFDLSPEQIAQMRKDGEDAEAAFQAEVAEGEKRTIDSGRQSQKKEFYRVGKQVLKAAFMSLLLELVKEIVRKLILWLKSSTKNIKTFIDYLKQAILTFFARLQQLLLNAADAAVTTVAYAILGPVVGLVKKVIVMLKQGWKSLKEAVEYLRKPENQGKPVRELLPQVGIIVISGLSAIGAMALGEVIEAELMAIPFLAAPIPVIGTPANLIGTMLGAIVCGVAGAIAINLINRYVSDHQKEDNAAAQAEKRNEILALQDSLIDVKADKVETTQRDVMQSIAARHKAAGGIMTDILTNVLDPNLAESQRRNSEELDRLLQGG